MLLFNGTALHRQLFLLFNVTDINGVEKITNTSHSSTDYILQNDHS